MPAIDWHTRYRQDPEAWRLVSELLEFMAGQRVPYVVGNDDGQLRRSESGEERRVDYNATLLFQDGRIAATYRKLHLVPFTEYFPFERALPGIYAWLRAADTHFWEKGTEYTVFDAAGVRFSTPICFEDTFGYLNRRFVRAGAEVLVNMTNDSWSGSVAAEMQHMALSLLRAVENRRSVVRATNGGITCIISPNGEILSMIPPFVEATLVGEVPVHAGRTTPYTRWGDWLGALLALLGAAGLAGGLVRRPPAGRRRRPAGAAAGQKRIDKSRLVGENGVILKRWASRDYETQRQNTDRRRRTDQPRILRPHARQAGFRGGEGRRRRGSPAQDRRRPIPTWSSWTTSCPSCPAGK